MTAEIEPGLYDIPADLYHSDPVPGGSLSSSGAKLLADCPARYKWQLDNPQPHRPAFEFGTAAHTVVLGDGPELVVVDADLWNTNEIKAKVAAIREGGGIPLKQGDYQRICDMAEALAANAEAAEILAPDSGAAEQSIFWPDGQVWWRSRFDWLRPDLIADYKTTQSVRPDKLERTVYEYGYHIQEHIYRRGAYELGLLPDGAAFKFIFQEKQPPYLVQVAELDPVARYAGQRDTHRAVGHYLHGRETGQWPAYSEHSTVVSLPPYIERQYS
ncbi:PD-(D/E)XK nuclease-like domain-containing protein [Streptomyces sp. H27-H1]|uniref:PD-(D/E)XK nuclease-like domain-containing protein n=1 Tax=Streptomyces sp. H27-H1 TaxID=2996461 RepID=UPI0022722049|nr:PD-(D/E)XK nuclease-like domain-containing protein [Streptomyces sp. H27-H1]MCY0928362.1 PD-(D/E)XK nuclease-like domain-containing protein [Streptomyces sp. H27-H1]